MSFRIKILQKLAQNTPAQNTNVPGNPNEFTASQQFPNLNQIFSSQNINHINDLFDKLNIAIYYSSNGQMQLSTLKSNNFGAGTTSVPSVDLKNLIGFAKELYNYLVIDYRDNKIQYTPAEIKAKIDQLKSSKFLNALPNTSTSGQMATKLQGNIKTLLNNSLNQIK